MHLEPHPVSGEVELDDVRPAKYRRLDEETLQSRLEVEQFELLPIYVWCETDDPESPGPGWKLSELRSIEDVDDDDGGDWHDGVPEANDAASKREASVPQIQGNDSGRLQPSTSQQPCGEDEDDDYWASYDRTPGRTPAQKQSPAPPAQAGNRQRTQSELDYYAWYGAEVQPSMDAHDPDEDHPELGESTLRGDSLVQNRQQQSGRPDSRPSGTSMFPAEPAQRKETSVEAPRAISPTLSNGSSIERLESRAAEMSEGSDRAQLAVKQHISTDIKSLFRLAKSSGMERSDFERVVKTELECLSLLERDE